MEDSDEQRLAIQSVLKRQMRDLIQQMREQGEEIAVIVANTKDETSTFFGTTVGEAFISQQKNILTTFTNFCKIRTKKRGLTSVGARSPKQIIVPGRAPTATPKRKPEITVQDTPTMKITVPKSLSTGISEQELGGLVGRIVASQLAENKDKGDGSSGGTKFDSLIEAMNLTKCKTETPQRGTSRYGRRTTNKYLDQLRDSAKKGKKSEDEDSGKDMDTETEEVVIVDKLADLDSGAMKRVQVKTGAGKNIDVHNTTLTSMKQLETLAASIVNELHSSKASGNLAAKKQVKVVVKTNDNEEDEQVRVDITGGLTKRIKHEDMDDSDTEYADYVEGMEEIAAEMGEAAEEEDEDLNDTYADDSITDPDFESPFAIPMKTKPKKSVGSHGKPEPFTPNTLKLIRKKKYQKPLSERMPIECEHCGQYVAGKSNLKSHIKRVHLKVKNHKCAICTKGFWSNNALESHMLSVHTRRCENCQEYVVESVPWGNGIDMRMKRDVICTCGSIVSIFSSFGRRRMYLRDDEPDDEGQTPDKPKSNVGTKYACGTCGKLFMKKSNCERHSRAHSEFKGINCSICGSSFAYENSLKRHLESEHGIVKHACEICGKNYSNQTALKVHYIKNHAQQNVNLGDNLVMIVKEKDGTGADTVDLEEQMEEIMEGEADMEETVHNGVLPAQAEQIVVTQRPDGSTEQHIMVTGPPDLVVSGSQELVVSEDNQLLVSQADIGQLEEGQVVVTQGEGGQVQVTTGDPGLTQDSAQHIVQQAIQEGHMVAQDGNMSIIIKHLPLAQVSMAQ